MGSFGMVASKGKDLSSATMQICRGVENSERGLLPKLFEIAGTFCLAFNSWRWHAAMERPSADVNQVKRRASWAKDEKKDWSRIQLFRSRATALGTLFIQLDGRELIS
jgi:hypothetical protein